MGSRPSSMMLCRCLVPLSTCFTDPRCPPIPRLPYERRCSVSRARRPAALNYPYPRPDVRMDSPHAKNSTIRGTHGRKVQHVREIARMHRAGHVHGESRPLSATTRLGDLARGSGGGTRRTGAPAEAGASGPAPEGPCTAAAAPARPSPPLVGHFHLDSEVTACPHSQPRSAAAWPPGRAGHRESTRVGSPRDRPTGSRSRPAHRA